MVETKENKLLPNRRAYVTTYGGVNQFLSGEVVCWVRFMQ